MIELDRREGLLGTIRILERRVDGARLYCLGASVQTMAQPDGASLFGYVHATKLLLREANDILLIGGGGGSLATMLARRGRKVTVVEADPVAEPLARRHFALDRRVQWINEDAFVFVDRCSTLFDAIVIDACDDEGSIPSFANADALLATTKLLRTGGSVTLNLAGQEGPPAWGRDLARAVAMLGFMVTLFVPEDGWEGNELIHVRAAGWPSALDLHDIQDRPAEVRTYLMSLRALAWLPGGVVMPASRNDAP